MTESRKTVLVVDDEDVICATLESSLSDECGYNVLIANSSSEASRKIQDFPSIEYIIIDLQLQGSSSYYGGFGGIALFLHIAEAHPSAKRIIYSSSHFETVQNQIKALNSVLQKEIKDSFVQKTRDFGNDLAEILKRFQHWWGNYYALLIAVQHYDYAPCTGNLKYPIQDIQRLREVLAEHYVFEPDKIYTLINPTRRDIIRKLFELADKLNDTDNLLIFYAGHGHKDERNGKGYWIPRDACYINPANRKCHPEKAVLGQKKPENTPETWLSHADVRDWVARIKTKHTLLITDSCYGGTFAVLRRGDTENLPPEEQYKYPSKRFMSSGNTHESVDDKSDFLEFLIDCLRQNSCHLSAHTVYESIIGKKLKTTPLYKDLADSGSNDKNGHFIFIRR